MSYADKFERACEIAAEATRDRETEAAHSGEGKLRCEAGAYAYEINCLHQLYAFDGMVALYVSRHGSGIPELHVMPDYFHENFGGRADITYEPNPVHACIRKSVLHEGVKIFCLEDAKFVVAA